FRLKAKMALLAPRLKKSAMKADCITVESEATRSLVEEVWGPSLAQKCRILTCGVDPYELGELGSPLVQAPYAVTIGAYPYKRIDQVTRLFRGLQSSNSALKLAIVGTAAKSNVEADNEIY